MAVSREEHVMSGLPRQMAWFVVIGAASTAAQAGLYVMLREWSGPPIANLASLLVTTMANTEAHRRVTFPGSDKPEIQVHLQAAVPLLAAYLYTSLTLAALDALLDGTSPLLEASALVGVTALGGLGRFAVLRNWVFRRRVPSPQRGLVPSRGLPWSPGE